jgi:hypothetical protein
LFLAQIRLGTSLKWMQDSLQDCSYASRVLPHSGPAEPQLDVLWYWILICAIRAASLIELYELSGKSRNYTPMVMHCRPSHVGRVAITLRCLL